MTNNNEDGISRANFKYLFRELALDSATRKAGGILIIIGLCIQSMNMEIQLLSLNRTCFQPVIIKWEKLI